MKKYQWAVMTWDSGWNGDGKKVDGVLITLPIFLARLEDEGWEIFSIVRIEHSVDTLVYCRKPR